MAQVRDDLIGLAPREMDLRENQAGVRVGIFALAEHLHAFWREAALANQGAAQHIARGDETGIKIQRLARFVFRFLISIQQHEYEGNILVRQGVERVEGKGRLMLGQSFLVFAQLNEAKSERVMRLNEIGIDLQGFLQVLGGGAYVAGPKSFLGALELFDGFGGNAQLTYGNSVARMRRCCGGI